MKEERKAFGGSIGFVLAAAGSAVGLGNIWRFPYLAAKDGGGLFLVTYIILALTFGFTLLSVEVAIGRKTKQSPLTAYSKLKKGWKPLGIIACLVPLLILPYYVSIGGWVLKFFLGYISGDRAAMSDSSYFTGYISSVSEPIIMMLIFLFLVAFIVIRGVNKGIENSSKVIMPLLILLVIGISVYCLTISYTDAEGVTRTGLEGLKVYLIPNLDGMTFKDFATVVMDAMGQLFFSLSVAMGIMVAYGSYVSDHANLSKSINQIEIFDTMVAFFAGVMIIPAVFTFMGTAGMEASGPSLMFISLPQVFDSMGVTGTVLGCLFFAMVLFAALTSAVSVMEAIVSSIMDQFHISRMAATIIELAIAGIAGILVCLGFNVLSLDVALPTEAHATILDIMDYISNNVLMPIVAIATCILIGWIVKPKVIIDEIEKTDTKMGRKTLFTIMVKYVAPVLLILLFLKSIGLLTII